LKEPQLLPGLHLSHAYTDEAFDALEPEWCRLLGQCSATVFQSFEWLRAWWKHFGGPRRLDCMVFRDRGALVGIAPLVHEQVRIAGIPVVRRLQFLGAGLSDYLDMLILPGYEDSVLKLLIQDLIATRSEWDVLDLEDVREASVLLTKLPLMLEEKGIRAYPYQFNVCPRLPLPGSWDSLLRHLGPNTRHNIRRKLRRLNDRDMQVEVLTSPTDDIEQGIDTFAEIHGNRWKSLGHPSAFDDPIIRQFHVDVARAFSRRGWLRLYFLKVDGAYVATSLNFNFQHVMYMYQCNAYGSGEIMRLSPGTELRALTMRQGIAEGMKVFDFLRGDETYKWREWKGVPEKNWMVRIVSRNPRSFARFRIFLLLEILSKSRGRILREIHDYVRFRSRGKASSRAITLYLVSRAAVLARLGRDFFRRHITPRRPPYE
jgi:CelD/BcsL family acetyltransferase involved in cellulose biosynthesis